MVPAKKSILIVDDHGIVRDGLAALIRSDPRLAVTAACGTCAEARLALRDQHFDLALVDVNLPDGSGLDLVGQTVEAQPDCRVLLLTMHTETSIHKAALDAGASAVLVKDHAADRLLAEISRVLGLPRYPGFKVVLSKREEQVLGLVLDGLTSKEIASLLGLSPRTIETYRERLHAKFHATSAAELARRASLHTPSARAEGTR